eukprot:scaffold1066_cov115-Isochrysis_galbana.AAC.1
MSPDVLGYAESAEEQTLGEETYTFLEGVANPFSCTILVKGAHPHVIAQVTPRRCSVLGRRWAVG